MKHPPTATFVQRIMNNVLYPRTWRGICLLRALRTLHFPRGTTGRIQVFFLLHRKDRVVNFLCHNIFTLWNRINQWTGLGKRLCSKKTVQIAIISCKKSAASTITASRFLTWVAGISSQKCIDTKPNLIFNCNYFLF